MSRADQLDDRSRRIFAAILQGALRAGRRVQPGMGVRQVSGGPPASHNGYGIHSGANREGPCCAVGAGVLYASSDTTDDPLGEFSRIHQVSGWYAAGVSDGFEGAGLFAGPGSNPANRDDYQAGRALGEAVYEHYYPKTEVPS